MADVSVRTARPEDAEPVARVQLATWQEAYAHLLPLEVPLEQVAAVWLHAIETPPTPRHRLLVALDGADVVGFAVSEPVPDGVELSALLVEPSWGRRGHGSRLLTACVDHWRGDGATVAVSWVLEQDAVLTQFLESAGWARDGARRELETPTGPVPQHRLHVDVS